MKTLVAITNHYPITRDQIPNIRWIIKTAKEFQKNIYFCFIDYAKAFDCVGHNKLWKILNPGEGGNPPGACGVCPSTPWRVGAGRPVV